MRRGGAGATDRVPQALRPAAPILSLSPHPVDCVRTPTSSWPAPTRRVWRAIEPTGSVEIDRVVLVRRSDDRVLAPRDISPRPRAGPCPKRHPPPLDEGYRGSAR